MSKNIATDQQQSLTDVLEREAAETRPEFSESLHARIVGAVMRAESDRRQLTPRSSLSPELPFWRLRWGFIGAAALCAGVALGIAWWQAGRVGPQPGLPVPQPKMEWVEEQTPEPLTTPDELPTLEQQIENLFASAAAGQWAYLDHDAQIAFQILADPLPLYFAPEEEEL